MNYKKEREAHLAELKATAIRRIKGTLVFFMLIMGMVIYITMEMKASLVAQGSEEQEPMR